MSTGVLIAFVVKLTVVLALAWVCAAAIRRAAAAVRHQVWASAVLGVLVLPVFVWAVPVWRVVVATRTEMVEAPKVVERIDVAQTNPVAVAEVQENASRSVSLGLIEFVIAAWTVGALMFLARLAWGLMQLRRLRITARFVESRPDGVRLFESARASATPMAWGWRTPCVLLPAGFREWDDERLRVVLAHELAHVRRRDWVMQIAAQVAKCVYWFHPLVWVAAAGVREESERAADDAVLRSGVDGPVYAQHLLEVARAHQDGLEPALAMASSSPMERRLGALLDQRIRRGAVSRKVVGMSFSASVALLIPFAAFSPAQEIERVVVAQDLPRPVEPQAPVGVPKAPAAPVPEKAETVAEPAKPLTFEVVSIRPNPGPWRVLRGYNAAGPTVTLEGYNIQWLVAEAYGLEDYQLVMKADLPHEENSPGAMFNIAAKAPGDAAPTRAQVRQMIQEMLASRFKMKFHWETRETPVYALTVAKGGIKFRESKVDTEKSGRGTVEGRIQTMHRTAATMADLVRDLRIYVDRPVVDKTGLKGDFDYEIGGTVYPRLERNRQPEDVDVVNVIQDVLGLRLEKVQEQMPVLVVEAVEGPGEN
jgi:uncharacterized protein (TIGR03435 family)